MRSCDALNENGAPRIDSIVHKVEKGLEEFKDGLGRAARAFIHALVQALYSQVTVV